MPIQSDGGDRWTAIEVDYSSHMIACESIGHITRSFSTDVIIR